MLRLLPLLAIAPLCLSVETLPEPSLGSPATPQDPVAEVFAAGGIHLDRDAGLVAFGSQVLVTNELLEYLLVGAAGAAHESLLVTDVTPSLINAAILSLGVEPGQNARYELKDPAPTEAELQGFYDANPDLFTLPETRKITYAVLSPDMVQDEVEVDEAALRNLYEERAAEYQVPERRLVERLGFASADEAATAKAQRETGGTTFEALVADRGLDLQDIDLGDVTAEDLGEAAEGVFAAHAGMVTGPLPTSLGPALFRINAVLDASEVPYEEAAQDLRTELAEEAARRVIDDMVEDLDDLLAGGATLEELEAETELQFATIDWFDGMDQGIAAYDSFAQAAAAAQDGDFPELLPLSDGGQFALRLDAIVPPAIPPLDEIEDEVAAAWRATQLRIRLEDRANAILANLALTGNLEDQGLSLSTEDQIRRQDFIPDAPPTLVPQVFQLNAPGDMVVIPGARAAYIARLDSINQGTRGSPEVAALQGLFGAQIANSISADVFEAFGQALEAEIGISLDPNVINAVNAQFP